MFSPEVEGTETVTFTAEGTSATVTIADEPVVRVAVGDATATELGPDPGSFTVTRGGPVGYDRLVEGTTTGPALAGPGGDYLLSGPGLVDYNSNFFTVRIPAGTTSVTVTVTPVSDSIDEGTETVTFAAEGTSATVTITDQPAFRTWISNAGGNWEDPTKWSGGIVPQPGETAVIDGDFTVNISSANAVIEQLNSTAHIAMSGGSISINGAANLLNGVTLTGGVLAAPEAWCSTVCRRGPEGRSVVPV